MAKYVEGMFYWFNHSASEKWLVQISSKLSESVNVCTGPPYYTYVNVKFSELTPFDRDKEFASLDKSVQRWIGEDPDS